MNIGPMLRMMLDQCVAEGVSVSLDGSRLVIAGQKEVLDEWRPLLRSLKQELLGILAHGAATVQRRAAAFAALGINASAAYALALRLETRDSQHDERRLCLECSHLTGTADVRRCAQWKRAGLGGPQLPRELPAILQRCQAFHLTSKHL